MHPFLEINRAFTLVSEHEQRLGGAKAINTMRTTFRLQFHYQ